MSELLSQYPVTHTALDWFPHPHLHTPVVSEAAVRYLRFRRPVRLDSLELPAHVYGRWVPAVPVHPAHLLISTLDRRTGTWRTVREVSLPYDPRIAGEGLKQAMPIEAMEAHFAAVLKDTVHRIDLGGLETELLRVVCDREHPHWPNHGEVGGGPHCVPFGLLNPLRAPGSASGPEKQPVYNPLLKTGRLRPKAPRGMTLTDHPMMLRFEGRRLAVGFSLRRPMLLHFGWDALGRGQARVNRLKNARQSGTEHYTLAGFNGPALRLLDLDFGPCHWTGEVSVEGNRVAYRRLHAAPGLEIDAVFTVEPDRLTLELTQRCAAPLPVLEAEAWRFGWDLRAGMTGCATLPTLRPGRNGDVALPALWTGAGVGGLMMRRIEGDPATTRLQVDSYRAAGAVTGGLVLAPWPTDSDRCLVLPAGTCHAVLELAVEPIGMRVRTRAYRPGLGQQRHFGSVLSLFRAEHRGFSNNTASVNVLSSQQVPAELTPYIRVPKDASDPVALAKYSVERSLLDGAGYGYWRNLYLDCDPILLSAAGRLHQARPDPDWLRRIEPGLTSTVTRMLGEVGEDGLLVCRDLSGNAGSYRWSANACDVVGFGHLDAYVNAWAYRGFRNAAALLAALGRDDEATRCRGAAARLRAAFAPALLNPKTGWVAGWRSRDGELHDYAFTWVNGPALAFGLLDRAPARRAIAGLERLREKLGLRDLRMGLPANLLPIREDDHMMPKIPTFAKPTFECYTDGAIMAFSSGYYLRALSLFGPKGKAARVSRELEEGYAWDLHSSGMDSGWEFRTWEGLPIGYEGTLIYSFGTLYGVAVEQGLIDPPTPEWWPEGG